MASFMEKSINCNNHVHVAFDMMDKMRRKKMFCDVSLVIKDVRIPAHKIVLAACSPYFHTVFTHFSHKDEENIELEVNPEVIVALVEFMYTSKIEITEKNVKDLLVANKIFLLNIEDKCVKVLVGMLHPENCLGLRNIVATYGYTQLVANIDKYISVHFAEVIIYEEFLNLSHTELLNLLTRRGSERPSEEIMFEGIITWIEYDNKARWMYLRNLMGQLRLPLMSREYIKQHVVNERLLRGDIYCKDLIISALLVDCQEPRKSKVKERPPQYSPILLAVGGCGDAAAQSMEYYDFIKEMWSTVIKMPSQLYATGLAAIGQKVYIIGGRCGSAISDVNEYDVLSNKWCRSVNMTSRRWGHGIAVLNDCIYAVGGSDSNTYLSTVEMFNLDAQKWIPLPPMSSARSLFAVETLDGLLYAVGGYNGSHLNILNTVECYDPRTNYWRSVGSLKVPRYAFGVSVIDGMLYAVGGNDGENYLKTVEMYKPAADKWVDIPPMKEKRACAGVTSLGNELYVVGGSKTYSDELSTVEMYNRKNNSWKLLPAPMNMVRSGHSTIVVNVSGR